MKKVALIGLGNIGTYYTGKLLEGGYPLTVYDIDEDKRSAAVKRGATAADSAARAAENSDFIILALPKSEIVELVMEGENGVLSVLEAGQIVIDTSTSRPKTAIRLEKLCEEKGAGFIDSPLTWRGPGKTHILMAGGKEDTFKKAEEVLKAISYKCKLFGPAGTGQIMKLINQAISADLIAVYAEAAELTREYGIDPRELKDYLMFDVPEEILSENYNGCGELGFHYKDMGYLLEIAHECYANIPISSLVHEMCKTSKVYGEDEPKWSLFSIHTYYKRLNNDKQQRIMAGRSLACRMREKGKMDGVSLRDYLHIVKSGPGQYHHRKGILEDAGNIGQRFGKRVLVSGGRRALAAISDRLLPSLERAGIEYQIHTFSGESSESSVRKILNLASAFNPDFIMGAGGGKSLDTAKISADVLDMPIITIPTIAATCSASSPLCILYTDEGVWQKNYYPKTNPNAVLVDPDVLLHAPVKYSKSGILDSLAKWYEGRVSLAGADNADVFDGMAIELAGYLSRSMIEKAGAAISACESGMLNQEFTDVVNMNVYTAGTIQAFGVKAVRNGIAHSVHNGLSVMKESHELTHGMKVGYGMAVQSILQQSPAHEFRKLMDFYDIIGLKPSFKGLDLVFSDSNVEAVAQKTVESSDMQRPPLDTISKEMVADAIRKLEFMIGE